jgi:hypothetical protein
MIGGVSAGSLGTWSSGATIGCAVDLNAKLIWFRVAPSGLWNNSGTADPATGTGGLNIATTVGGHGVAPAFVSGNSADTVTLNLGNAAFSGTAPSGFRCW